MTVKELKDVSMNHVDVMVPTNNDWDVYHTETKKTYTFAEDNVDELKIELVEVEDGRLIIYTA